MNDKLIEMSRYWNYSGESKEIDDIVTLREIACSDVHELIAIIKEKQEAIENLLDALSDF